MNKLFTTAAIAGIMAATAMSARAEEAPANAPVADSKVKCFGIAKAGKNDCHSANGSHECAGSAKTDNDPNEWAFAASADECTKAGGKVSQ